MSASKEQDECLERKAGKRTKAEYADVRRLWERESAARASSAREDRKLMAAIAKGAAA